MRKVPYLNIILFILTFLSTLTVGALYEGVNLLKDPMQIYRGLPFSVTLLAILLAHELSHYLSSKKHRVDATLPYFIPAPTIFGTFGAFIKMKSPIATRNALMDIGASGPIAGFVLSVFASVVGLFFSSVAPVSTAAGGFRFGDSLLFGWLSRLIVGPMPANYDVVLNPVAFAGWIGFFVTSLNLIPVGQLDGGHIAYALLGERHTNLSKVLIGVLVLLGLFVWDGWMVWAILLLILGFRHPPIMYSTIPLDSKRRVIGWAALVIFVLTFIPVPVMIT
jgi:membrane-associated protease RseP (regulator of RpoE activity)